jgi:peptidylprolyl isomerase
MARAASPDSADSQFFIMFDDSPHLDGKYSIWGQVIENVDLIDNIKKGSSARNGAVEEPDCIVRLQVAADVAE